MFSTKWASPEALRNSIQAHGGMGVAEETGLSEPFKDAIVAAIYEGASEVQQNLIFGMTLGNLNTEHGKNLKKHLLKSLQSETKSVYDILQKAENLALITCLIQAKNKDIKDLMNDPQATLQHYTSRTANIITFNAAVKQLAATLQNRDNNKLDTKTDTLYLKLLLGRALEETLNNLTQMGALKADPDTTAVNLSKSKILSKTHKALSYIGLGDQLESMVDQKGGLNRQQIEDELRLYQKELNPIKSVEKLIDLI